MEPCMCGDPQCPRCGTAQGTYEDRLTRERREYAEAEIAEAGLDDDTADACLQAIMSGVDIESDDDFELMVQHCIQGHANP